MPYDPQAPRKVARTVTEIQAIEDRLAGLQHEFREIRNSMRESEMETVDLALNTFTLYLDKMEPMAKKYRGQLEEQQAVLSAKQARERKRTEIAQKQKKSGK